MPVTTEMNLSDRLRECTATAHTEAEKSPFMDQLLGGDLRVDAVADLTGQLWFIYTALERGMRSVSGAPHMSGIFDARLERLAALELDLAELIGPDWAERIAPTKSTGAYVDRLNELAAAGDELGLIAHHYVRYLGDLSGGQIISRMLAKQYGISREGVNFYDFSAVGKVKPYRDEYRGRLDALGLGPAETEKLVSEAINAFRLNGEVFNDLAGRHLPAA